MKRLAAPILVALIGASVLGSAQLLSKDSASAADPLARFYTGSRSCTGKTMQKDMKTFRNNSGKYTAERTLDGHWVVIHYREDASPGNDKPFSVVQYFGYDAEKKQYIAIGVYNSAGYYSVGTSAGWQGDSITFDEKSDVDKPAAYRDIFTASDGAITSHTGMARDPNGQWIKTDEEKCSKAM